MESLLGEVAGNDNSKLEQYNKRFFEEHLECNTLFSLLQCSDRYLNIIWFLNERYCSKEPRVDSATEKQLKDAIEKREELRKQHLILLNNKQTNTERIIAEYAKPELDFIEINQLENLDKGNENLLSTNKAALELARGIEKFIKEAKKEVVEIIEQFNREMESKIKALNNIQTELEGSDAEIELLRGLDLDSLKEEYEERVSKIIENDSIRGTYINYMFTILEKEIQVVLDSYEASRHFVASANKENGFLVPELMAKNSQLYLAEGINHCAYRDISDLGNSLGNKENSDFILLMSAKYMELKPFMYKLYEYVDEFPTYVKTNQSQGRAKYTEVLKDAIIIVEEYQKFLKGDGMKGPYNCMRKMFETFNSRVATVNRMKYPDNVKELEPAPAHSLDESGILSGRRG